MTAITIPIPPGHVLHWKHARNGSLNIELMRFVALDEAKSLVTSRPVNLCRAA